MESRLIGTWKLVSFEAEIENSPERIKPWGDQPNGYVSISADGLLIGLLTAGTRKAGETDGEIVALYRSMVSYAGRYTVDGDKLVTRVDTSWNEAWNGSDQERTFRFIGEELELTTAWMPSALMPGAPNARGVLLWKRAGHSAA